MNVCQKNKINLHQGNSGKSTWGVCIILAIFFVNVKLFQNKVNLEEKLVSYGNFAAALSHLLIRRSLSKANYVTDILLISQHNTGTRTVSAFQDPAFRNAQSWKDIKACRLQCRPLTCGGGESWEKTERSRASVKTLSIILGLWTEAKESRRSPSCPHPSHLPRNVIGR